MVLQGNQLIILQNCFCSNSNLRIIEMHTSEMVNFVVQFQLFRNLLPLLEKSDSEKLEQKLEMDIPNRLNYDQTSSAPLSSHHMSHHMAPYASNMYDREGGIMDGASIDSKRDISDILQQIMTITDQSLDEAQAR